MGLQVGDVVRLAGGGPDMTIVSRAALPARTPTDWTWCYWFTERKLAQDSFPTEALVLVRPRDGEGGD